MESDEALLLKVGRNLLLYQKAELLMKELSLRSEIVVTFGEKPAEKYSRRSEIIANETLGQVTRTVQQRIQTDDRLPDLLDSLPDGGIATTYSITMSEEDAAAHRVSLDELLKARNAFIHRLYPRLLGTKDEPRELVWQSLDEDHDRFAPIIARLETVLTLITEAQQKIARSLGSDEGKAEFSRWFDRTSPLVMKLAELHPTIAKEDGWASLNQALHEIRKSDPPLIDTQLKLSACKSSSELLLRTGAFELREQPRKAASPRTLYRPRPPRPRHVLQGLGQWEPATSTHNTSSPPTFW